MSETRSNYIVYAILVLDYFRACSSIEGGMPLKEPKTFIAYLVNAYTSNSPAYIDWLCGGALVSESFILTSAACVEDAKFMYAIAGYNNYVTPPEINKDTCTSKVKRKVVFTCVPKTYRFTYEEIEKWANIDIALVKVDKPYDFNAAVAEGCSWVPSKIRINYKQRYQQTGVGALLFGWGHSLKWRDERDATLYNQKSLQYTHTQIIDKKECKKSYNASLHHIIDNFMICTNGPGNFDDQGVELDDQMPEIFDNEGCSNLTAALRTQCLERQQMLRSQHGGYGQRVMWNYRRNGICQNDHGGPVTTFAGAQEVLIGIASVFLIRADKHCVGPFLHTSTFCNSAFISCILDKKNATRRYGTGQIRCPDIPPPEISGITIQSRRISWARHPDGPAADEMEEDLIERPQIPIQSFS